MLDNIADTGLKIIGSAFDRLTNLAMNTATSGADSLVQVSQVARVEPITLIDQRAQTMQCVGDVAQSLTSIFAGYYLQAAALSGSVGRVSVIKLLDKLSPTRLGWMNHLAGEYDFNKISTESWSMLKLPDFTQPNLGLEGLTDKPKAKFNEVKDQAERTLDGDGNLSNAKILDTRGKDGGVRANKDLQTFMNESVNLSVGKMIEVTIEDKGSKAVIPIAIRLLATVVDPRTLVHILSDNSRNTGFSERWHGWKSGELRFWKDLVFCQDLIAEHRAALLKDQTSVYSDLLKRRLENAKAASVSGTPSLATASNLVIITSDTAKELELQIGGQLKNYNTRKRVFNSTYLMIMAVIDPEWEHVIFYTNGIASATTLSFNQLKNSNKGNGPDVMELLKAFQMGNSPQI